MATKDKNFEVYTKGSDNDIDDDRNDIPSSEKRKYKRERERRKRERMVNYRQLIHFQQ